MSRGHGRGLGRRNRCTSLLIINPSKRKDFVEHRISLELFNKWESYAIDILPQFDGVQDGDWEEAGYVKEKEFPVLATLENYGKEWDEYEESLKLRSSLDSTELVISDKVDDESFDEWVDFQFDRVDFRDLDEKVKIDDFIDKCYKRLQAGLKQLDDGDIDYLEDVEDEDEEEEEEKKEEN